MRFALLCELLHPYPAPAHCCPFTSPSATASTLSPQIREAFDLFDTDGSGTIDAKELKVAMR
jgi:hypothetical protein